MTALADACAGYAAAVPLANDRNARRPLPGTLWAWEPESAPALIKVTAVLWNGEEWWVTTRTLAEKLLAPGIQTDVTWNDLSRFWEACHYIAGHPGPPRAPWPGTRDGLPQPEELVT